MKEGGGGGCTSACIHMGTHVVILYYKTTWRMFMKLGTDEIVMALYIYLGFLVHLSRRPSSVRRPSLTFHILDFSSESSERNSTNLDRREDLNVLY